MDHAIVHCPDSVSNRGDDNSGKNLKELNAKAFSGEHNDIAGNDLLSFPGFDFPVHGDKAVPDDHFCFAATGSQAMEFQQLVELDRFAVDLNFLHLQSVPEILELQRQPEVTPLQQRHDGLQIIAFLTRNA